MHKMFRQYAQQMGMQNVRAILPEQIDLLINNSISDTINQVITQNIGITNDRVISDASKLNQINALKSLYKVWKGNISAATLKGKEKTNYIISFQLPLNNFKTTGSYTDDNNSSTAISFLYVVDLSINYKKTDFVTNIFPVRIVDDQFVARFLNGYAFRLANNTVTFRIKSTGVLNYVTPVYADNTAALAGGLVAGDQYKTSTGVRMEVY